MNQENTNKQIFISYRQDDVRDPSKIVKGTGVKAARALFERLTQDGYSVFFDGGNNKPRAEDNIPKSKLVLILVANHSLADPIDGESGFLKELSLIKEMVDKTRPNPNNTSFIPININHTLDDKTKLGNYKWLNDKNKIPYICSDSAGEISLTCYSELKERINKLHIISKPKKWRKIAISITAMLVVAMSFLTYDCARPLIVTTGSNTVSEYLKGNGEDLYHEYIKGDGMSLNTRHRFFFHSHSRDAWGGLLAAFRGNEGDWLNNFPIILTVDTMPPDIVKDVTDKLGTKKGDYRILQYLIDSINLAVYLSSSTLPYVDYRQDTISKDSLLAILNHKDSTILIMGTDSGSTTTNLFTDFIGQDINLCRDTAFRKYDDATRIKINSYIRGQKCVIVFDNTSVENDTALMRRCKHSFILPVKMPLFAYTIVKLDEKKSHFRFIKGQESFFKAKRMNWDGNTAPEAEDSDKWIASEGLPSVIHKKSARFK